jgi:monothiol glutaredoxin
MAQAMRLSQPSLLAQQQYVYFSTSQESDDDFKTQSKMKFEDQEAATKQIEKWVSENDVVLFMKGTLKMPRCGFSNYVTAVLKFYNLKGVKDVNVLDDEVIRETIKEFSNWPTIPQLYIKGQFVGGCDIVKEMHQDGSLEELL